MNSKNENTALLIIDVQTGFTDNEQAVHQADAMLTRIRGLIDGAHQADVPVVYVRHDEEPEIDWPIHPTIAPREDEMVIGKMTPDSFHETDLKQTLEQLGVQKLVIAGFQSEYCISTTSRRAAELGYDVVLVQDAHSTFDGEEAATQIIDRHNQQLGAVATMAEDVVF